MDINKVAFFTLGHHTTAIEHLRVLAPLSNAGFDVKRYVFDDEFDAECINPYDIIVIQRDSAKNYSKYEELIAYAKQHNKPVILDLDDNLLKLPLSHPDRQSLYYTDSLLPLIQSMAEVDTITVTNEALQNEVKKYNDNVFVLPNYLDDYLWRFQAPKVSDNNDEIKILYMGSHSHRPDLDMIADALEIILNVYPNVNLYSFGIELPKPLAQHIRAHHIPSETVEYNRFAKSFNLLEMDIAIAPLVANTFNSHKSPLKFFEYSANALAGVFSDVEPYKSIIKHRKNGLLSKNDTLSWTENLELLINNRALREQISKQAQQTIRDNYLLSKNSSKWRETYTLIAGLVKKKPQMISLSLKQIKDLNQQFVEKNEVNHNTLHKAKREAIDLQAQNSALQTQFESSEDQNSTLRALCESLESHNFSLEQQNGTLQARCESLEDQNGTLQARCESLESQNASLERQNDTLHTKTTTLELEKSNLFASVRLLTNEVSAYALSNSWRVTRLFRKIKKRLQRRKNA